MPDAADTTASPAVPEPAENADIEPVWAVRLRDAVAVLDVDAVRAASEAAGNAILAMPSGKRSHQAALSKAMNAYAKSMKDAVMLALEVGKHRAATECATILYERLCFFGNKIDSYDGPGDFEWDIAHGDSHQMFTTIAPGPGEIAVRCFMTSCSCDVGLALRATDIVCTPAWRRRGRSR